MNKSIYEVHFGYPIWLLYLIAVKLNGSRQVTGVLRGFDPFMNLVVDEAIEETKTGQKNNIGMVVSILEFPEIPPPIVWGGGV